MLSQQFVEEMKQRLLSQKAKLESDLAGLTPHEELGGDLDSNVQEVEDDEVSQDMIARIQLDLEKIASFAKLGKRFTAIVSFPSIKRDISLVIKEDIDAEEIFKVVVDNAGDILEESKLNQLYRGQQIPEGFKGIVLSLVYQAKNRTLTDSEVNATHEKICQAFRDKLQAKIR